MADVAPRIDTRKKGLLLDQLIPVFDIESRSLRCLEAPVRFLIFARHSYGISRIANVFGKAFDSIREGMLHQWRIDPHVV